MVPKKSHVRAILADYGPHSDLIHVAHPSDGIANNVFYLSTVHGDLVLRVFADDVGMWKPQKERALYAHMRSLGIPAPVVYRVDTSRRVVPFTYSLSARIDGETFSGVFGH